MRDFPTRFYGKKWMLWAWTLIFGFLGAFMLIAGLALLLGLAEPEEPGQEIWFTLLGAILLPSGISDGLTLWAFRKPIFSLHREGMEFRVIGVPREGVGPLVFLFAVWDVMTGKAFRVRTIRIRWEHVESILLSEKSVIVAGLAVDAAGAAQSYCFTFNELTFNTSIKTVVAVLQQLDGDAETMNALPGWDEQEQQPGT